MDLSKTSAQNEQGFVLVLALFMLTICTIIGMAAMNTSITEVDIAGNEKVHKETSYQAEAGYAAVVAALFEKNASGEWSDGYKLADFGTDGNILIRDNNFLSEPRDDDPDNPGKWDKDKQNDNVKEWVDNPDPTYKSPDITVRINNQSKDEPDRSNYNLDMDVDKVDVRYIAGGGVEFAAGAEGIGVSTHRVIYNIDCIGTISSWDDAKNKFIRELRLTDKKINPATPRAEVVVGYGYVPW